MKDEALSALKHAVVVEFAALLVRDADNTRNEPLSTLTSEHCP